MKVYAIYEGCRFEGGGVQEIYAEKEKAIKFALMLVEQKNKRAARIHKKDEEWKFKEQEASGIVVKCWQNPIDEIIIYEYEVK